MSINHKLPYTPPRLTHLGSVAGAALPPSAVVWVWFAGGERHWSSERPEGITAFQAATNAAGKVVRVERSAERDAAR